MNIQQSTLSFITAQEGCKLVAYQDTGGVWTIGVGTTHVNGQPVHEGMTCTQEQAEEWLRNDLQTFANEINSVLKVTLPQASWDAIASFTYNLGFGNFKSSHLLALINQKEYLNAANEFPKWDHDNGNVVEGLLLRRQREQKLFLSGFTG